VTVKADPDVQLRLLDLQALDSALDRLTRRRATLPEIEALERLDARSAELRDDVVRAETEVGDLDREQRRLEADIDQVRARATRDQERLDSGAVAPKQMTELQHELGSLARRQRDLEDQVLEIMERREPVEAMLEGLRSEREQVDADRAATTEKRDAAVAEIDAEAERTRAERGEVAAGLPADLVALYEQIRARSGGLGAAALGRGRCGGCRLELPPTDLNRIRSSDPDTVVRCEECRRILVRTPESGL
jgi:uncharacterized protein